MDGYARLARDMGNYRELGIIRGFKKFNLQNLLYLQAELNKLEFEHKELVEQNSASTRSTVDRDWDILIDPPNDSDKKQWQKFLEIRGKLKEYNEQIAHIKALFELSSPTKYNIRFLREYMSDKTMGEYPILDRYQDSWSGENTSDLVTFSSDAEESVFTQFLYDRVLTYFHYLVGDKMFKPVDTRPSSGLSRLTEYKDSRLAQFVRIFSGTAASLICLLPVVFLHLATAMRVRLGLLAAFSAIFSLALTLMTKASQAEIFAATAAFAAVQVVFIGTTDGDS